MISPQLVSIQVGEPREHGDSSTSKPSRRRWTTGFYKSSVAGPVAVGRENLAGDRQADLVSHGGMDKAVCVYSFDHYAYWREALEASGIAADAILPGAFGENFTVAGFVEADVCIGDVWRVGGPGREISEREIGDSMQERAEGGTAGGGRAGLPSGAVFEVSQPRQPCWKLGRRWGVKTLAAQVIATGKTGWYFRVVEEGVVTAGMEMTLVERLCPTWTVERANRVMYGEKGDREAAARLAAVERLSESWRRELQVRSGG